jgi:hypothetical protein
MNWLQLEWQRAAPQMEYLEWLRAEIPIQLELLEDEDDPSALVGAYGYIADISREIQSVLE